MQPKIRARCSYKFLNYAISCLYITACASPCNFPSVNFTGFATLTLRLYDVRGRCFYVYIKVVSPLPWEGLPLRENDLVTVLTIMSGFLGLKFVDSWSVYKSADISFWTIASSVRFSKDRSWSMVYLCGSTLLRVLMKLTLVYISLKLTGRIYPVST